MPNTKYISNWTNSTTNSKSRSKGTVGANYRTERRKNKVLRHKYKLYLINCWDFFFCVIPTFAFVSVPLWSSYAKQLIEGTIRRNASPVRLEANQGGSCSSLASSTSDETQPRANRNSSLMASGGGGNLGNIASGVGAMTINQFNQHVPNHSTPIQQGGGNAMGHNIGVSATALTKSAAGQRQIGGHNMLLHSLSTNDASLGEYKYTVSVGHHNIKITGDCFELVRVIMRVDQYYCSWAIVWNTVLFFLHYFARLRNLY